MARSILHIKKVFQLVFLLGVLISLTPCSVKESFLGSFDFALERPLNKTKTAQNFNSSCIADVFSQTQTEKQLKSMAVILPYNTRSTIPLLWATPKKTVLKKYTKKASGNSPPIYILYKRLKFDMA